jgi:hypothetical protein
MPKPSAEEKNPVFFGSSFAGGVTTGSGRLTYISAGGGTGESEYDVDSEIGTGSEEISFPADNGTSANPSLSFCSSAMI